MAAAPNPSHFSPQKWSPTQQRSRFAAACFISPLESFTPCCRKEVHLLCSSS
jgi:hypothetical protein